MGTALLSITQNCLNRGNLIIEYATLKLLGIHKVDYTISAFKRMDRKTLKRLQSCSLLILPGATLFDREEHPAMLDIHRVGCPVLAIGVAFCTKNTPRDATWIKCITSTIGSRDPVTHQALCHLKIKSVLAGCSTLSLGNAREWRKERYGPIVISLGRGEQKPLQKCVKACARIKPVILLEHVPELQDRFSLPPGVTRVPIQDALHAIDVYKNAALVLTGRIHGLLLCIAFGIPVIFFGSWYDSRYSLLEYLGIKCYLPVAEKITVLIKDILEGRKLPDKPLSTADRLRKAMNMFLADCWNKH